MTEIVLEKVPNFLLNDIECVERKGKGHPDTLADKLAEFLSIQYSKYTLKKFGVILSHSFDRLMLLGGHSEVSFGWGELVEPIKVLLAGRITKKVGQEILPCKILLKKWTKNFFEINLPTIDVETHLTYLWDLITYNSPSYVKDKKNYISEWASLYEPKNIKHISKILDIKEIKSNDLSIAASYYPLSDLEKFTLYIEHHLNSNNFHKKIHWIGYDIKIISFRKKDKVSFVFCIPQIAEFVNSLQEYDANKKYLYEIIFEMAKDTLSQYNVDQIIINPRDVYEKLELYLTAIGTSLERGDKGVVGRGNRQNGLITPLRPMSIEGRCGKNWFSSGKIYNIIASDIAKEIWDYFGGYVEVIILSYHWHPLNNPWKIIVRSNKNVNLKDIKHIIEDKLSLVNIKYIINLILEEKIDITEYIPGGCDL